MFLAPYALIYAISALIAGTLGYWALTRADMRANRLFGLLMAALCLWSLVGLSGLFIPIPTIQTILQQLWAITGLSVVWLWVLFTTRYTDRPIRRNPVVLFCTAVYLVFLVLALSIPFHELYYGAIVVLQTPFPHVEATPGPARLAVVGYTVTGILTGTFYLSTLFREARHSSRTPTVILAGAVLLGFVPFAASELQYTPVPTYNHTIFGVSIFVFGVSYAVYEHSFYQLAPVGRSTILDTIDDPMFVCNHEWQLVDYNPAATTITPSLTDQSIGLPLSEIQPELAAVVTDSTATSQFECSLSIDAEERHFSVVISDITRTGNPEGYVLLLRDITERQRREQTLSETKARFQESNAQLEQANERLDNFASVVAHDLRNPLAIAMGYTEIAEETGKEAHFEKVESAHDRMDRLIEDLLTLARNEATVDNLQDIDIGVVARDAWEHVDTPGSSLTVADDVPVVSGDSGRIVQLFENVFRNAIEHAGDCPDITVGGLPEDTGFFIEDDGVGIPADMRNKALDHGVTTNEEGTGFGLSIVADIAAAHGWAVTVTAGADGGARFEFCQQELD